MPPVSESKHKANEKYNAKAYDFIGFRVPKGRKEVIADQATAKGESLNGFINRAINELMEREKPQ